MVQDIEAAMDQDIDTLDWMSPATKVRAKEKLHAVADKIGYPDHWRDYSALVIVRDDAFGNALRATDFENRRQLAKIGKPVDRGEWQMSPPTVNAYYDPSMNDINFPAGILQGPLYDSKASDASNYGHIGGIVGHELTHGFDDEGRQFDANGNLADWWTAEDGKLFDQKADCEVKEYGNFVAVDDVKVNGKADAGREHRRQWRPASGLRRVPGRCQEEKHRPGRKAGRLHSSRSNSSWDTGRAGAAAPVPSNSGCKCKPIRIRPGNSGRTAWCRICRNLVRPSAANPVSP